MSDITQIAFAGCIDVDASRRIWIPPSGKPFWVLFGKPNAGPDLTDDELREYKLDDD